MAAAASCNEALLNSDLLEITKTDGSGEETGLRSQILTRVHKQHARNYLKAANRQQNKYRRAIAIAADRKRTAIALLKKVRAHTGRYKIGKELI